MQVLKFWKGTIEIQFKMLKGRLMCRVRLDGNYWSHWKKVFNG